MKTLRLSLSRLSEEIDSFLVDYLKEKGEETKGTYQRALRTFQRYFSNARVWFRFRAEDVEQYKKYLTEEKKLSQVSVSTYLTALRRLLDYFVAQGLLEENPAKKVKGNRRPTSHTAGALTEAEVQKLLSIIPTEKLQDHRDYLIIRLMLEAAAREHEIVKANVEDLKKFSSRYVLFVQAKGKKAKDETVEVPLSLGQDIEAYLERRGSLAPSAPLFASNSHRARETRLTTRALHYRIQHWLEEAGIHRDNISPHSLRHTAAKLWLERDKLPLEEVKRRMRHGLISTTKIYAAESPPPDSEFA
ncbi:MAG: site-specific integrase [Chloroherpetonaceae bacterium]|nr:site-specific integrase [Chloroherpetonaceae bacterium]MDW8438629.1 tyrosine-type recombinase/integrase [Chloroherpetonaceae bacterium]